MWHSWQAFTTISIVDLLVTLNTVCVSFLVAVGCKLVRFGRLRISVQPAKPA